jgi:hypothetical protein
MEPVAHTCNPSYSGDRSQEDHSLKPAQANSSTNPISKKKKYQKGLVHNIHSSQQPHGAFSKIDHILGDKASLNKYKKIEINPCKLSDHNAIKLELKSKRSSRKYTNNWQLDIELLGDQLISFIVVLGGGTSQHLQRFLQCIKYIILEFTPSTILLHSPLS